MNSELLWCFPFAALLACIALLPLFAKHWWEKNFALATLGLATLVLYRYVFILNDWAPIHSAAHEYFSFICLIGSLFIIAGGIHIDVKGEATPAANTLFLFIAAILSNILGTTGASMIFIRPWIRMNKYRITAFHIIFFIFIVSNVGGSLTPIGDPPLFLGYLRGVPFFWVIQHIWPLWMLAIGSLLTLFFILDARNFSRAPKKIRVKETAAGETWKFQGALNVFLILVVVASVFLTYPNGMREAVMIICGLVSYYKTPKALHKSNDFGLGPIREVAILFAGIFITMVPALQWLEYHAASLGIRTPLQFYWASGTLSSFLDNAPTYLAFLSTEAGLLISVKGLAHGITPDIVKTIVTSYPKYILAISAGSVFFGAVTYIGNGPNFLVKSIAEQFNLKLPSFLGYVFRFSLPILIPIFAFVGWLFLRAS